MTEELVNKLRAMEQSIVADKGSPFQLFALFLPEDEFATWDLVVSAPWAEDDEGETTDYLVAKLLEQNLTTEELSTITGFVVIESDSPYLQEIKRRVQMQSGESEFYDTRFFDYPMTKAIILTPQSPSIPGFSGKSTISLGSKGDKVESIKLSPAHAST